ncbi:DNA replication protein DnaC [Bacillus badius]|nr:DNA replication protein DnaC [Bacillus badius]
MQKLRNIQTFLNTTSTRNQISISENRCENKIDGVKCNKQMIIEDGKEFCFYCEEIKKADEVLGKEAKSAHRLMTLNRMFNNDSLINERLKNCNFGNYEHVSEELAKAKAICQRYAEHFTKSNPVNLMMIGNYGTGKSHLAVSILKRVIERGLEQKNPWTGVFISTPKLMTKLKATYHKKSKHSEDELLEQLGSVDLLILDDVGTDYKKKQSEAEEEEANQWATLKLFEVIDSRIGKHTVYTTNFNHVQLMDMYGEQKFSRMVEGAHSIKMNGENYRLRAFK